MTRSDVDRVTTSVTQAEDRVSGIVTALVDSGLGDIYNRVLCPTCIVQIIIINTMVVSVINIINLNIVTLVIFQFFGKLLFWGVTSSMPSLGAAG